MLQDGSFDRMIGDGIPGLVLLTEAERTASLTALLAARPEPAGTGAWVFAYGSLIWNPAMNFVERRFARLHGWHRSFCLSTKAGRGSPELPGLVLGLDRGGACAGAAFLIAEDALEAELALLWKREMLSGSYTPRWVRVRDAAGIPFGHAITFTINRQAIQYCGILTEDELVHRLTYARGSLGSSADYLFQTRDGLRLLGIVDRRIEYLAAQVEAQVKDHP
jgi:cation transport protein ChaC